MLGLFDTKCFGSNPQEVPLSWCSHLKAGVGAYLSKLLVFSCQQTRFDSGEQCADWSLLKAIRVKGGVGEPGKKKSSVQSFTQFVFSYLRSEENPGNKFVAPLAKGNLIIAQETPNLIQMIVFPERGRPVSQELPEWAFKPWAWVAQLRSWSLSSTSER